jgi:hypothetical protein
MKSFGGVRPLELEVLRRHHDDTATNLTRQQGTSDRHQREGRLACARRGNRQEVGRRAFCQTRKRLPLPRAQPHTNC